MFTVNDYTLSDQGRHLNRLNSSVGVVCGYALQSRQDSLTGVNSVVTAYYCSCDKSSYSIEQLVDGLPYVSPIHGCADHTCVHQEVMKLEFAEKKLEKITFPLFQNISVAFRMCKIRIY